MMILKIMKKPIILLKSHNSSIARCPFPLKGISSINLTAMSFSFESSTLTFSAGRRSGGEAGEAVRKW